MNVGCYWMATFNPSARYYMINGIPITDGVEAVTKFGMIDTVNKLKQITSMPEFDFESGEKLVIDSFGDKFDSLSYSASYMNKYVRDARISKNDDWHSDKIETRLFSDEDFKYCNAYYDSLLCDLVSKCEKEASDILVETLIDFGVTGGEDLVNLFSDFERANEFASLYNQKLDLRPDKDFFQSYKIYAFNENMHLTDDQINYVTDFIHNWLKERGYLV